jgi:hypothetical protein
MFVPQRTLQCAIVALSVAVLCSPLAADTLIVRVDGDNGSADPPGDGSAWGQDAFKYLSDALIYASEQTEFNDFIQVWIAATDPANPYVPYRSAAFPNGQMDPELTFTIEPDISWYGGFAGNESLLNERDPYEHVTVLSGLYPGDENSYQSYHVVSGFDAEVELDDVIDGFTITLGNARIPDLHEDGGGMWTYRATPSVVRCRFESNRAIRYGGGLFSIMLSGRQGRFVDCVFDSNYAIGAGGGAGVTGGGATDPDTEFTNCLFLDNVAHFEGGAFFGLRDSDCDIVNCTFVRNETEASSTTSGGLVFEEDDDDPPAFIPARASVLNCILYLNSSNSTPPSYPEDDQIASILGGVPNPEYVEVRFCCIQELDELDIPGAHNIGDDPMFIDDPGRNYRLCAGSPCIDTADEAFIPADALDVDQDSELTEETPDLDLNDRVTSKYYGIIAADRGAYEFRCFADLNGDCTVDISDVVFLFNTWGECPSPPCEDWGDMNHDGYIDPEDLGILLDQWGCGEENPEDPPQDLVDCYERYQNNPEKLAACVEAILISGGG